MVVQAGNQQVTKHPLAKCCKFISYFLLSLDIYYFTSAYASAACFAESLPKWYSAHVCVCITGLQHSALYQFGRFACFA